MIDSRRLSNAPDSYFDLAVNFLIGQNGQAS